MYILIAHDHDIFRFMHLMWSLMIASIEQYLSSYVEMDVVVRRMQQIIF